MRLAVAVATAAVLLATFLAWTAPAPPDVRAAITQVAVPAAIHVGEAVSVRASAVAPAEEPISRRLHVCDADGFSCRTTGWGEVDAGATWIGGAGEVLVSEPGDYVVEWTLYADWDVDARRAVTRFRTEVTARVP